VTYINIFAKRLHLPLQFTDKPIFTVKPEGEL